MNEALDKDRLRQQLIQHEGLRLFPYVDTVGKLTIGCGRNLTDRGISHVEAIELLDHDIEMAIADLLAFFPWVARLDAVRKAVLVDMCFNLGITRLREFANTMGAVERGDYAAAADGMRKSKWAKQVGNRAVRLRKMMVTGLWPSELNA
jgi:lysozyme